MKAKKTNTQERNQAIRQRFEELDSKNMYKFSYIVDQLAKQFYLAPLTIENIIYGRF